MAKRPTQSQEAVTLIGIAKKYGAQGVMAGWIVALQFQVGTLQGLLNDCYIRKEAKLSMPYTVEKNEMLAVIPYPVRMRRYDDERGAE